MASMNLGQVRFVYKGEYDSEATYSIHDWVSYNGSSFVALRSLEAGTTPSVNDTVYWATLAEKGATGTDGADGVDGQDGADGATGATGAQGEQGLQGPAVSITSNIFDDDTIAISTGGVYDWKQAVDADLATIPDVIQAIRPSSAEDDDAETASEEVVPSELAVAEALDVINEHVATSITNFKGHFVGEWVSLRNSTPPTGYYVRNGALISNASTTVPLLWAYLQEEANTEQCITQTEWDEMQAETYTLSTGTTGSKWDGVGGVPYYVLDTEADTLRLPDTRGMFAEDAGFDDLSVGGTHGDMTRNVTGSVVPTGTNNSWRWCSSATYSGAFYKGGSVGYGVSTASSTTVDTGKSSYFSSDRITPTGNANKPRAFGMLPCVYAG